MKAALEQRSDSLRREFLLVVGLMVAEGRITADEAGDACDAVHVPFAAACRVVRNALHLVGVRERAEHRSGGHSVVQVVGAVMAEIGGARGVAL